jgi:hypothetical protein
MNQAPTGNQIATLIKNGLMNQAPTELTIFRVISMK